MFQLMHMYTAHQALLIPFQHLKVRALECATEQSKLMARKVAGLLLLITQLYHNDIHVT